MRACPMCGTELKTEELKRSAYIDSGVVGEYKEKRLICPNCGSIAMDDEIMRENRKFRNEFWRDYYGFLSLDDILMVPKKYRVSKEIVEKVLDVGAKGALGDRTIWKGELPTAKENERLKKSLEDPMYFLKFAEESSISDHDKERIRKRVEKLSE